MCRWALPDHAAHAVDRDPLPVRSRQPPCGSGLVVGRGVGAGLELSDHFVWLVGSPPCLLAKRADAGDDLRQLVSAVEVDREEAVVAGRAAHRPWLSGDARNPHRHARALHRPGQEAHRVDRVVLATVANRLAGPGRLEDLERLVEHPGATAVVALLTGDRELACELVAAEADAKRQPAAAEQVESRGLP